MKTIIFAFIITLLIGTIGFAFQPFTVASEAKRKGTTTVSTTSLDEIMFQSDAAATVSINGTGTAFPVNANTPYIWSIKPSVTSLVFGRYSAATNTTIYTVR